MRLYEFLTKSTSNSPLVEGLMKQSGNDNDWLKDKYYTSFFDGILNQQVYAFMVVTSEKEPGQRKATKTEHKFSGIIQNPENVIAQMKRAIKTKDFSNVTFEVEEVDDQTLEPSGEVWEHVRPGQIFKDEKVKGELDPNMGNVTEAILGCAVAAKFSNQGNPITERQVVDIGRQLAKNKGLIKIKAGKDELEFKVRIPFMDNKAFYAWLNEDSRGRTLKDYNVPDKKIALFDQRLKSALEYANNSKRVAGAVQQAVSDPRENKIDVVSDGAEKENQNTTKVDLKILIDGKETASRLLSVKAGEVEQFGQAGGHNFANLNDFFTSIVGLPISPTLQKKFYDIPYKAGQEWNDKKRHNFDVAFGNAYADIAKQITAMAKSQPDDLIENVYKGLLNHLTRNEAGVEMVILNPSSKKAFSELSFGKEFEQALRQLQLYVDFRKETGYVITIYGIPKSNIGKKFIPVRGDPARLIDLRSQFDNRTQAVRNRINMGPLLKNIADIENYIEQVQDQQADVKPVQPQQPDELSTIKKNAGIKKPATAPKPALKTSQPMMGQAPVQQVQPNTQYPPAV